MADIGAIIPAATRVEPSDVLVGNVVEFGGDTRDIPITALRRSNANNDIESINNSVRLKTNNIVGVQLAQNGDFSIHGTSQFTKKSNGFTGFGTANSVNRVGVSGELAVGAGFVGTAAPPNGVIIQGSQGVGTTSPSSKSEINGGVVYRGFTSQQLLKSSSATEAALILETLDDDAVGLIVSDGDLNIYAKVGSGDFAGSDLKLHISTINNIGIGTSVFGTSAEKSFAISNGIAPTTSIDNQIEIFSIDVSSAATLGFRTELDVAADVDETQFSHKIGVNFNGVDYFLMMIAA